MARVDATGRYVSLVPSLTESLFAMGVGDRVVGVTKFCVHPEEGLGRVERVGGTKDPKIEAILALNPTLVFANQEENRREDVEALRDAGVPVHLSFPRRVADVGPMLADLGEVVGREGSAAALVRELEAAQADVETKAPDRPVRFLVLIWRRPWMAASADTFLSDLLVRAGGLNVMARRRSEGTGATGAGATRYPEVTARDIERLEPEVVLLPSEPYPFQPLHRDELVRASRIGGARFVFCDGELLTWHGVRTAKGLHAASEWLTPAAS